MTTFILTQRDPMNEKSNYPPYDSTVFFVVENCPHILPFWTEFLLLLKAYPRGATAFQGKKK